MNPIRKQFRPVAMASALAAASMVSLFAAPAVAQGPGFEDPNNWPQYHRTSNAWRFSPLNQVNRDNLKELKVAWIHQPGTITHGLQATPIVIDGVMYSISANNNVWAIDPATGK